MRCAALGALANQINHELRANRARLFSGFGPKGGFYVLVH